MSRIKQIIQNCIQTHDICSPLSEDQPLPKRVLDIEGKPIVRTTNGARGRYVALSYCWGKSGKNLLLKRKQNPTDKSSTFDEFTTAGIEMSLLPKTAQDAISVCRYLGIKYLWIDALCIVQQEPNLADFKAEAPRMCDYYTNAYLTLIARSASDCAEGFLNERRKPQAAPCEVVYNRTNCFHDESLTGLVIFSLAPSNSKDVGPITERAWTFQEDIMSRRSLVFGLEQFSFKCLFHRVYEDGDCTHFNLNKPVSSSYDPFKPLTHHISPAIHSLDRFENTTAMKHAYDKWYSSIYTYCRRDLTEPMDKLAALAGYANMLQPILRCRYMFGLWGNDLIRGLSWETDRPWVVSTKSGSITRDPNRAPSWSWASINGLIRNPTSPPQVKMFQDPSMWRLGVLSYKNVPQSLDPIRDKLVIPDNFELTVRGFLKKVWHIPIFIRNDQQGFLLFENPTAFHVENPVEFQDKDVKNEFERKHIARGLWDTYDDFEKKTYWTRQVCALALLPTRGLLLAHQGGKHYRRVGWYFRAREDFLNDVYTEEIILI
jgi:hypothetical protein